MVLPALLISMSNLSSLAMYSCANCRTEKNEAKSKCRTTTLVFPVEQRISSAAFSAFERSRQAITTRAPKRHRRPESLIHTHIYCCSLLP